MYGITGGDGTLMAIGNVENYISSDGGTNWTLKYDNTTTTLNAGAYYNNTFVGVGNMDIYGFDDTAIWGATRQDNYITDKVLTMRRLTEMVFSLRR